jgi:hypothetical protein
VVLNAAIAARSAVSVLLDIHAGDAEFAHAALEVGPKRCCPICEGSTARELAHMLWPGEGGAGR